MFLSAREQLSHSRVILCIMYHYMTTNSAYIRLRGSALLRVRGGFYDMFDVVVSRLLLYDVVVVVDRKPSRSSPTFGFDMVRRATASQMERARELLEIQQKRGVPLFGKGSGRGRKKSVTAPCVCIYICSIKLQYVCKLHLNLHRQS